MKYYIVYFNTENKVIDVSSYTEEDYIQYLAAVEKAKQGGLPIQSGYF